MARPIQVVILGQVFSVTSDDGEEHIQRVARYVDGKMREIAAGGKVASAFTTAVLAALNIASECHKLQQNVAETEAAIDRLMERLDTADGGAAAGAKEKTVRNG